MSVHNRTAGSLRLRTTAGRAWRWRPRRGPDLTGVRTCVGEAKVKDIWPGPAAGAGAAAASA